MAGNRNGNKNPEEYRGGGRRKKKGSAIGTFFSTLLLVVAIGVFSYSAWKLYGYYKDYKVGTDEYSDLNDKYVHLDGENVPGDSGGAAGAGKGQAGGNEAVEGQTEENGASAPAEYDPVKEGKKGTPGIILKRVEDLENPATVKEKVAKAATEETEENGQKKLLPVLKNPINFQELNAINEEVIGWIRIGAIDKSYPVAQAADNDFYLHRTFEKQDNFAGCIFLNCENSKYFTDQNSIIYGHNMRNGSMFGLLKSMQNQETYDKNPYFWIFTPTLIFQYRIFSCSVVSKVGDPYKTRFLSREFQEFLDKMSEGSYIDSHGVKPTARDRIVTLSTCTGDDSTRFIVQGVLEQMYIGK